MEYQHHICCNYQNRPIGESGCICKIITKKEFREIEALKVFVKTKLENISNLPCRVDEMTEREHEINKILSDMVSSLEYVNSKLENL